MMKRNCCNNCARLNVMQKANQKMIKTYHGVICSTINPTAPHYSASVCLCTHVRECVRASERERQRKRGAIPTTTDMDAQL
jgi:hypothetical protein